ncbi:hypothetical protein MLD38_008456 [Melastoma candidum]|uniref:Uncharacterized protein n=1 Tax=Melastoma candidum TaxID=119954 RepID=A0ACB9RUC0_9MYRT|nr:hypothetical protein MLD38_008456 [Melastoma candidum]
MIRNRGFCFHRDDDPILLCLGLDLNLSVDSPVASLAGFSCKARSRKRLQSELPLSVEGSAGRRDFGTVGDNLRGIRRLHFRDHIWAYSQWYLAVEAMDEAAASIMRGGGGGGEQEEVRDQSSDEEMRLVQQLAACAEAVACRDRRMRPPCCPTSSPRRWCLAPRSSASHRASCRAFPTASRSCRTLGR